MFMGMLGGLVHAVATVTFGVDHIISGVAINIIALGAVQYLASLTFVRPARRRPAQSEDRRRPDDHHQQPGRPSADGGEEGHLLRLTAGGGRPALITDLSMLTIIALLLLVTYVVLWRTSFGLRLRSWARARRRPSRWASTCCKHKFVAVLVRAAFAGSPAATW